jgi:hypothetical protein
METKCTCERPDDNTCDYCEQQSSIQILEEAAAKFYREYPTNPLDSPERHYNRDVDCFKKRKAFINGAKWQAERMYSEEDMNKSFFQGWVTRERFDDQIPDIIYPQGLDYEEKQEYAFNLWFEKFKKK